MLKRIEVCLGALLLFFMVSCKPARNDLQGKLFSLMPASVTQIHFQNTLTETEEMNIIEYLYFNNGAGIAAGDINNDGLTDLYFTANQLPDRLYLNKGNFRFEDITEKAGVKQDGNWKTGVTMADVNGDGLLDIYVCQVGNYKTLHGKNRLYINQGNLTFKEQGREYGLDFCGFSTQAAFFDYDTDGDLDMYLLNHSVHSSRNYGRMELRFETDDQAGDKLFRNDDVKGKRIFHDVTKEAGILSSMIGYGLGLSIADINNDGYPDIYVSNDFHENDYLYINNGNGTFSERLTDCIRQTSRSSMGNDIADINNDGLLDIFVLDMLPYDEKIRKQSGGEDDYELYSMKISHGYNHQYVRNTLQLNLGDDKFSEIGRYAGIYSTDWSWSPLFCDVDNDGLKDLFITNGIFRRGNDLDYIHFLTGGNRYMPDKDNRNLSDKELYSRMPLYPAINFMYRNNGDLTFRNMATEWGLSKPSFSNGSAYADLDNDGDLDLVVNNLNEEAFIYRNNAEILSRNHYINFELKGDKLNVKAVGARVVIYIKGLQQCLMQFPERGFLSSSTDVLHFGLGNSQFVDSMIICWPDRTVGVYKNLPADTTFVIDKATTETSKLAIAERKIPQIIEKSELKGLSFDHKEDSFTDFNREMLIPHDLGAEGPALAIGDVNADGLEDVFIGGAKGQKSYIFLQRKNGFFEEQPLSFLPGENTADDTDALFFDADNDGDKDLYIVRGGNELSAGNENLHDVLLINDGKGTFKPANKDQLPVISHQGSCVRAADYDNDGDLDLFVGSRSIPGAYGLSPVQFLLENNGLGYFTDVTNPIGKAFRKAGMVTDVVWIDYDRDGDQDLTIAGEWMKISMFRNDRGKFSDVTSGAGFDTTSGWWNCIEAIDIDGDGDEDLVAGNLGKNTMLKASLEEPVDLYLNDFDNNGTIDPVICAFNNGISYLVASIDELKRQISFSEGKIESYSTFAGKTIRDIFDANLLKKSFIKRAVMFESCVFINRGNGTFETTPLPSLAQFSPIRDILPDDLNGDGLKDLVIVGNDFHAAPSFGRYDAGYGWYAINHGKSFGFLRTSESGLMVEGDARKCAKIDIAGKSYIIVVTNNGPLQSFLLHKNH